MSSRIVKGLLLASALLIALPVVAAASTARVQGMGIQGDFIKDYTNVYTYLSNICCVGNVVYGELGNTDGSQATDDRAVGAFLNNLWDGKYGAIGVRLSEETAQLGQGDANTPVGAGYDGWDPNTNTSHAFDIMWGKKFGAMTLGLRVNRSYARLEGDPTIGSSDFPGFNNIKGDYSFINDAGALTNLNYFRNILGFGGGIGFEMSPSFSFEGSMLYQSRTFEASDTLFDKNLAGGMKLENDGSGAYLMALRGLWQWQPSVLVVPVVKYYNIKADWSGDFVMTTDPLEKFKFTPMEDERSGWQIGLAGNWTLNQNDLFVLGGTLAKNTRNVNLRGVTFDEGGNPSAYMAQEIELTETLMPSIFAALETHVNSWLTLRFGAQQGVFYSWKDDFKDLAVDGAVVDHNVTTGHYSPFEMMLGTGCKFGNLQLDAILNQEFVHNAPYFVSGETTSTIFPKVTATYTF